MVHKYRLMQGDKVGVYIDYFNSLIPAKVVGSDDNMIKVDTGKQKFFVPEHKVESVIEPAERQVVRYSERMM